MKLLTTPADGIEPILAGIRSARRSVEIAVFRLDRRDVEAALMQAAQQKHVKVSALIAYSNRGGEKRLRELESRFLEAGITVTRTADDLTRYHNKYILIDRRVLYVLSFNFTHLDVDRSRGFGIVTQHARWVREAGALFDADCLRRPYVANDNSFVVSPVNARKVLIEFLKRAKKQLLIYDPEISDPSMLHILNDRAAAGVEIRVIGKVKGHLDAECETLKSLRLHTRTIVRDGRQAFVGSQSLRALELDSRRELGLVIHDSDAVKRIIEAFDSDWVKPKRRAKRPHARERRVEEELAVLEKDLAPLAVTVRAAVSKAVTKAGIDVAHDPDVKDTVKRAVRQVMKGAVKAAVKEAKAAKPAA
jgi:cardiolipin synthase